MARELGALAVRGNHDDGAVLAYNVLAEGGTLKKPSTWGWVAGLSADDMDYLNSLPFTISLPAYRVMVVHAGVKVQIFF